MSAICPKRTFNSAPHMSASGGKADIEIQELVVALCERLMDIEDEIEPTTEIIASVSYPH